MKQEDINDIQGTNIPFALLPWHVGFLCLNFYSSYCRDIKWFSMLSTHPIAVTSSFRCFPLILSQWQVVFDAFHSSYCCDKCFFMLSTRPIAMTSGFWCFPLIISPWQVVFDALHLIILSPWQVIFDAFHSSYRRDKWFLCFPLILSPWQVVFDHTSVHPGSSIMQLVYICVWFSIYQHTLNRKWCNSH